ncbi:hypothetical protein CLV68_4576 [Actinokineospora cianjurensis]|uniref:Uncharacterized protein n=1 Tax=Actinokineospora cianjurensis TaxID=585224 RepID=A0A421B279_9PSEU|nr:hypothetical protein CLV68_4576 [Actinokineospora cianjurensis]
MDSPPEQVHVRRVAYEDRYPPGTDLHDAVYEDLRRYCAIFGLTFTPLDAWFFTGQRWRWWNYSAAWEQTLVRGVRASVSATRLPVDEAARRKQGQLRSPRPIPPGPGRRHWNDVLSGMTRRERRRARQQRRAQRRRAPR